MKIIQKLSILPAFILGLMLMQCQETGVDESSYSAAEIRSLAKLGVTKTTSISDHAAFEERLKKLDEKEMDMFDDFLIVEMREVMKANGSDLSIMDYNLTRLRSYRKALNETSVKENGVPYNQLSGEALGVLLKSVYNENDFGLLHSQADLEKGKTAANCPTVSYPRSLNYSLTRSFGCTGWRYVNPQGQSDCDFEFTFIYPNNTKIWSDYPVLNIVLSAGGTKSLNFGGFDTKAQIGEDRINGAGGPGWCQGGLRMGF